MPTFTMTKNWDDGTTLTESQLDDIKTSTETFLNSTKLDADNLQDNAITSVKLASSAVTTTKIDAGAVTGAKLDSGIVDDSTLELSSSTLKIKDSGVTTAKLNNNAVTKAKLASLGQQISSGSGSFSTGSTSYVDVTNLSVSITTTGRPVFIGLISDDPGLGISQLSASSGDQAVFKVVRDSTDIASCWVRSPTGTTAIPASSLWHIEVPAAGTYTYKIQGKVNAGSGSAGVSFTKLIAYEL